MKSDETPKSKGDAGAFDRLMRGLISTKKTEVEEMERKRKRHKKRKRS